MTALPLLVASACLAAPAPELPHGPTPKVYTLIHYVPDNIGGHTPEDCRAIQIAALTRATTLEMIIKQPAIANLPVVKAQKEPIAWIQKNLRVEFIMEEVVRIGIDGEPPDQLAAIVDAVASVWVHDIRNRVTPSILQQMRRGVESMVRERQSSLRSLEQDLKKLVPTLTESQIKSINREIEQTKKSVQHSSEHLSRIQRAERLGLPRISILKSATAKN